MAGRDRAGRADPHGLKVAVIGGGSTYTPELLDGLDRLAGRAAVREVILQDIDADRLDVVGAAAARIAAASGFAGAVSRTTDLARAVDGADAVVIQIRVGGQAARHLDETIPPRFGCIGQETTGAGGFAKALRTVPVVLRIAEEVRRRAAPGAWIVDFANPVGIVTRALVDHGHRAIGLCNVAIGFQLMFADWLGVRPEDVGLGHVGLNHLTWIRSVVVEGSDALPGLLADHGEELATRVRLPKALLDRLAAVPSYYLRYFYAHDEAVADEREGRSRAEEVATIERRLLDLYRDPTLDRKPELLSQRGGAHYSDAALNLLASLVDDRGDVQVVDIRNAGTVPELPADATVEIPARIGRDGARPVAVPPLTPHMAGLASHVAAYERLTVQAAVSGDRDVAIEALMTHPLVGQAGKAEALFDALVEAHRHHLPAFA